VSQAQTVKLASTRYLDNLHTSGDSLGRAFRDLELEEQVGARRKRRSPPSRPHSMRADEGTAECEERALWPPWLLLLPGAKHSRNVLSKPNRACERQHAATKC
jgi:hypothetical protein